MIKEQEVYVRTDNAWQSDLDATAYDGKQYHFDKHKGYLFTPEEFIELYNRIWEAGKSFGEEEPYSELIEQKTTFLKSLIG
jgi:hypothetical protein